METTPGLETVIQLELWSQLQTGNVIIDSIFRSLLLGLLVGLITSFMGTVKDDLLYPLGTMVKTMFHIGRAKTRKFNIKLEGYSLTNKFMNERYIFSVDFKAVVSHILGKSGHSDIRNLVQFHNQIDIKYDRYGDTESRDYQYSYILDQNTEVCIENGLYATMYINNDANTSSGDEKGTKNIQAKTYIVNIGSDVMTCHEIMKWIK